MALVAALVDLVHSLELVVVTTLMVAMAVVAVVVSFLE